MRPVEKRNLNIIFYYSGLPVKEFSRLYKQEEKSLQCDAFLLKPSCKTVHHYSHSVTGMNTIYHPILNQLSINDQVA